MTHHLRSRLLAGLALAALGSAAPALAQKARLEPVAVFPHQVTGVAVSKEGRVFVNFPRWTDDAPVSVGEVKGGRVVPYPDAVWNSWRNAKRDELTPNDRFVCVQSVVADGRGSLWVLDPAAPALEQIVKGGPKLVRIDLATNKVVRTYPFDERAAPQGTYLNDIRFSPDGRWGYITDSGRGAILVIDLESGEIRRLLDGVSSTQAEKGVVVRTDGQELRRPDGRAPVFNADGIELSKDGATLYWQAISSRTFYSIATDALRDSTLGTADLEARIQKGATVPADGLWLSSRGQMFVTSPEDDSVKLRAADGTFATIVRDPKLRWPDSMAEGPDGKIYVTSSRIQDNAWFKMTSPSIRTELYRFVPPRP